MPNDRYYPCKFLKTYDTDDDCTNEKSVFKGAHDLMGGGLFNICQTCPDYVSSKEN